MRQKTFAAFLIAVIGSSSAGAQAQTAQVAQVAQVAQTAAPPAQSPSPLQLPSLDSVRVLSVRRLRDAPSTQRDIAPTLAGLGDIIVVHVSHLQELVNYAGCMTMQQKPILGCQTRDIALFLDGREIKGIAPESGAPRPDVEELQFHLARTVAAEEAWADLLGNPPLGDGFFKRPTALSVGLSGLSAFPSAIDQQTKRFELVRIRQAWFIVSSIVLAVILCFIVWKAKNSSLLRDPGPVVTATGDLATRTTPNRDRIYPPYSLGRVQMAFWFALVLCSFVYIWLVTGGWDTITGTVLGLIGIGTGTALGAAVIDTNKPDVVAHARRSVSFIDDVLTDANGLSFHRFQMFAWTVVLGVLFVYSVWQRLSMPEFSATLMGLLGISSGTYLGFKIPEKQA